MAEPWFTENLPAAANPSPRPVTQQRRRARHRRQRVYRLPSQRAAAFRLRLAGPRLDSESRTRRQAGADAGRVRASAIFSRRRLISPVRSRDATRLCTPGIGTSWRESERIATTVKGTKKPRRRGVARPGVKRFIHISTIALYGDQVTGTITEETPARRPAEGMGLRGKQASGRTDRAGKPASRGLPAVVLRVAVVYGPHNLTMVARPLQHLAAGQTDAGGVPRRAVEHDLRRQLVRRHPRLARRPGERQRPDLPHDGRRRVLVGRVITGTSPIGSARPCSTSRRARPSTPAAPPAALEAMGHRHARPAAVAGK